MQCDDFMRTTREMIGVMQAFEDGRAIQYLLNNTKTWIDAPRPCWNWYQFNFRVKPPY